jgi:hypothetical protein
MHIGLVDEHEFLKMIEIRGEKLLGLLNYLAGCDHPKEALTRPLLGELLSQAMQLEEILDSYDAGKNRKWCTIRSLTATIKSFSDISYELIHIRDRISSYRLLPVDRDFVAATEQTLAFTSGILARAAREMVAKAKGLNLKIPQRDNVSQEYAQCLPQGHLAHDCGTRRAETVAETVATLTTEFLNLASGSEGVRAASRAKPEDYDLCLTESLREERLRSLEFHFHNLQSQYDTYVSGTESEQQDKDLVVLRGHVSVVFHLLKTATVFAHYYERHVDKQRCATLHAGPPLLERDALLSALMNYAITFIDHYIGCAVNLCQEMLQRYAEVGEIEVAIPKYRGFHVRPSTLVAKLTLHYGSKVHMRLEDQVYDARSSLDLFRANEKINAQKRRWLAAEIVRLGLVPETSEGQDIVALVRGVVLCLAAKGKLILYEQPLELPDRLCPTEGTLLEKVTSETGRLLALGKIDISIGIKACFIGDKRVLGDIQILAKCGYGEDNFGNNIALPDKLTYLKR